jgi:hypothetical protein
MNFKARIHVDSLAYKVSDNEAADQLQQARRQLFTMIHEQERRQA